MASNRGRVAFKYSEVRGDVPYDLVAAEYYDEIRHPTCADFREASKAYLEKLFVREEPNGRIADIGCGRSIVLEVVRSLRSEADLVLVDESQEMLRWNDDIGNFEVRTVDVEESSFGANEFDWIFAILADPFNSPIAWKNIQSALCSGGQCIFVVPSFIWSEKFRSHEGSERRGYAHFLTITGSSVFLPSMIFEAGQQKEMIEKSGLTVVGIDHVFVNDIAEVRSSKISNFLGQNDPVLDVYRAKKLRI